MEQVEIIPESIRLLKIDDATYFGPEYKDYISNSKLKLINPDEGGSREKYEQGLEESSSSYFELGSAIHAMMLQTDAYDIAPIYKPTGKLGLFAEELFKFRSLGHSISDSISEASKSADYFVGKLTPKRLAAALKELLPFYLQRMHLILNEGKEYIYLSLPTKEKCMSCVTNLKENDEVLKTLYPTNLLNTVESYNEYTIVADIIVTLKDETKKKYKFKAKLDNFTINHETQEITLNDLKTTGKPIGFFMGNWVNSIDPETGIYTNKKIWYDGSFQKFHYNRQMGIYLWLINCYLVHKQLHYTLRANMVVVETIPNYTSKVYHVSKKEINKGLAEFKKLLLLIANE
jgi:hypothetical protein